MPPSHKVSHHGRHCIQSRAQLAKLLILQKHHASGLAAKISVIMVCTSTSDSACRTERRGSEKA